MDDALKREIVAAWSRVPEFFEDGCKYFMRWVKEYGEAIGKLAEERHLPPAGANDHMTVSDTDHAYLPSTCQGEWRPIDLCHPCGAFGIGADLVTPYSPVKATAKRHILEHVTDKQDRARDCMLLWRVYAKNTRRLPTTPGQRSLFDDLKAIYPDFDLRRFMMDLGAVLDSPAGPAMVTDAWRRVERDVVPPNVPVTDDEMEVLFVLDERDTLTTNPQVVAALKVKRFRRSETTVKGVVNSLIDKGLVARDPATPRKGVALTESGRTVARR